MNCKRLLLVALVPMLGGCLYVPDPWTTPAATPTHHALVLGDSLTVETQETAEWNTADHLLADAITAQGDAASVDAVIGANTGNLTDAEPLPTPGPDVLVIALGTNDMHGGVPVAQADANIQAYVSAAGAACVALVNIYTNVPTWGLTVTGPPYNTSLTTITNPAGTIHVDDWNTVAQQHPEWYATGGPHFNDAGTDAYRTFLVSAAEGCIP